MWSSLRLEWQPVTDSRNQISSQSHHCVKVNNKAQLDLEHQWVYIVKNYFGHKGSRSQARKKTEIFWADEQEERARGKGTSDNISQLAVLHEQND